MNSYTDCTGYGVSQFVEALLYKSKRGGFDSRWGNWEFSVT